MDIEEEKDKGSHLLPDGVGHAIVFYKDQGLMGGKGIKRGIGDDFGGSLGDSTVNAA